MAAEGDKQVVKSTARHYTDETDGRRKNTSIVLFNSPSVTRGGFRRELGDPVNRWIKYKVLRPVSLGSIVLKKNRNHKLYRARRRR